MHLTKYGRLYLLQIPKILPIEGRGSFVYAVRPLLKRSLAVGEQAAVVWERLVV